MEAKLQNTGAPAASGAAMDIAGIFARHADTVYRVCYSYLGAPQDAEDATQSVFMKLIDAPRTFDDTGHEKGWLIVCAANHCKDILKSAARTRTDALPEDASRIADAHASAEPSSVLQAVLALPDRYKDCVYMHYYEGYKTDEIAALLGKPPSTVRNDLRDARALLKSALTA